MKKVLLVIVLVAAAALGGCMQLFPPTDPDPPPDVGLTLTATAVIDGLEVSVSGVVTGGMPPYVIMYTCNAQEIDAAAEYPLSPSAGLTGLSEASYPFTFVCRYDEAGTYTIVIVARDADDLTAWHKLIVTVSAPPIATYTIIATAGAGGSISPSGSVSVTAGDDKTFTIRVFTGHTLGDVLVDGISALEDLVQTAANVWHYTFLNVQSDHTIEALFGMEMPPGPPGP